MKLLVVVAPMSIYHGCYTQKTFWGGMFIPGEFTPVNMKTFGRCNVRKHREIKNCEKYITLEIFFQFVSLDSMEIIYSKPKDYLGRLGKGLVTSMGINIIGIPEKKRQGVPLLMSV